MVLCCGVDWGCLLQLWHKVVLRKWLNIGSGSGHSDFSADEGDTTEGEPDYEGKQMKSVACRLRRHKSETLRSQYIDIRELRICIGTWNIGGRLPPSDLRHSRMAGYGGTS